jgi:NAD(P)-dependent dehydrogenase (short-subunit alcohol dehydrogenase family)
MYALDLSGRVAIVTGAGQGIGEAIARGMVTAGAAVALVGRTGDKLRSLQAQLPGDHPTVAIECDVSKEEDVTRMIEQVTKELGSPGILVNNAGVGQWSAATDLSLADWDHLMATNLTSAFLCSKYAGRQMIEAGYGKVINISSISGSIVNREHSHVHYGVSKAGMIHLTRSLAAEWAPHGVRVNCISPGYTETVLLRELLNTPEGQIIEPKLIAATPLGYMAAPEDMVGAAVFFASSASDYCTGQDLQIDGGYTVW